MILTRRTFLVGGSSLIVGVAFARKPRSNDALGPARLDAFVAIDNKVRITCHRSEMGQGVRSSIPVLIADELGADLDQIVVVQGDGDPKYGDQNTDGSTSIRKWFDAIREAGAVARTLLITAAAKRWKVAPATLTAQHGYVTDGQRKASFEDLAVAAAALPKPEKVQLRPRAELHHLGTDLPLYDGEAYVTGTAAYAADVRLPNMQIAVIARPPDVRGAVAKVDDAAAKAIAGVRRIVTLPAPTGPVGAQPLGGVAVLADTTWAAMKGRAALRVEWKRGPNGDYDSAAYNEQLLAAVRAPGEVVRHVGDAEAALASAAVKHDAEYLVPHLAHAPMEPPAAIARVERDRAEVWACTQDPQDAREEVAKALGFKPEQVTMHVTFLGGGFGRKSIPDYCVEAALLAREANAPVRVQWTREDELRHAYYHTVSAQRLEAGIDGKGNVVAWRHRLAYPSIGATFADGVTHASAGELGQGVLDLPLAIPNVSCETGAAPAHVRIGWMRSVNNVQQAFAQQSFICELAHLTKRDPRDMLLAILGAPRVIDEKALGVAKAPNYGEPLTKHPIDLARFQRVIARATEAAGWGKRRDLGLAVHRSFLSYICTVVAVDAHARITEAWTCVDAGTVINTDRVRAQMEGAVIFGMSSAMYGAIEWKAGAPVQTNFHDYRLLRMPEAPRAIHVDIVESDGPPGGIGEPGVPPVAPAAANAIFAVTGKRIRNFPFHRSL